MATKLDIRAHAEMIPMEVSGIVGGSHVVLILGAGNDELSIRVKIKDGKSPFTFLTPGDRCFVTLGAVKIGVLEVPDELPGLGTGLIKGVH